MIWVGGSRLDFVTANKNPVELQLASSATITSTNGISMGNGTLKFSSWTDSQARTIDLRISPTSTTNYAIQGSLSLEGSNNGTINAQLGGKGLFGNLTLRSGNNSLDFLCTGNIDGNVIISGGTNKLTFDQGQIKGGITVTGGSTQIAFDEAVNEIDKIWMHSGTNTLTFNNDFSMSGNDSKGLIYAGNGSTGGNGTGKNTLIFKGLTNTLASTTDHPIINIQANVDNGRDGNTYNKLIFEQGTNKITGKIFSTMNGTNQPGRAGKNIIQFGLNTLQNTINGAIDTDYGYNTIAFEGGVGYTPSSLDDLVANAKNKITGDIQAKGLNDGGSTVRINNIIYFREHGYIEGNIQGIKSSGNTPYGVNLLVFEKMGYIKGNVTASGDNQDKHANYLVFQDDAKIEGSVENARANILIGKRGKTLTITDGINGPTKIWGTSKNLIYSNENQLRTGIVSFFGSAPQDNTLLGTLDVQNGAQGTLDIRVDTLTLGNNTANAGDTFALKANQSIVTAKNATIDGNVIFTANNTLRFLSNGSATINGNVQSMNGIQNILFFGTNNKIGGNVIETDGNINITLNNTTDLTLEGASNQISNLTAITSGESILKLGKSGSGTSTNITTLNNGSNLKVVFISDQDNNLTLNNSNITLGSLNTKVGGGTIALASTVNSFAVGNTSTDIIVTSGKTLNFSALDNASLNIKNAINAKTQIAP